VIDDAETPVAVRTVHAAQTRLAMQAAELTNYIVKQHGRY
jgi:hypothetical protein